MQHEDIGKYSAKNECAKNDWLVGWLQVLRLSLAN